MRGEGLELAIEAAGSVGALARALGISQPAVSKWHRVPTDRVIMIEAVTGVPRATLRPDLYPLEDRTLAEGGQPDEIDALRAEHYDLLSVLLGRAPTRKLLAGLARLEGDETPLGLARAALGRAACDTDADAVSREFFNLFVGVGRGELLPYGSYYLTGFLNERPLARVREDLAELGLERAPDQPEPEDHLAVLLEVMAHLASGRAGGERGADAKFFERHVRPFAERFFSDLEAARSAHFYRPVGALGRLFIEIETEAFAIDL